MKEKSMPAICPNCRRTGKEHIVKDGTPNNQQRFKCKHCDIRFTPKERDRRSKHTKKQKEAALDLIWSKLVRGTYNEWQEGWSLQRCARELRIPRTTLIRWFNKDNPFLKQP